MKNSIIKVLSMVIIAVMMMSTVASAAATDPNTVNVYEDSDPSTTTESVEVSIPGLYEDGTKEQWEAYDLSGVEQSNGMFTVMTAGSDSDPGANTGVLNHKIAADSDNEITPKNGLVIEGYIIPDENRTSDFSFKHDDGIKVFIDNEDGTEFSTKANWTTTSETEMTFSNDLEAYKIYPIRIEYFDWGGTEVLVTNLPFDWFYAEVPEYTVTYVNGKTADETEFPVKRGSTAQGIADPIVPGFSFNNDWTLEVDGVLESDFYDFDTPVVGDITLVGSWTEAPVDPDSDMHSVVFKLYPGTSIGSITPNDEDQLYPAGTDLQSFPVAPAGYTVDKWYGDFLFDDSSQASSPQGDDRIYNLKEITDMNGNFYYVDGELNASDDYRRFESDDHEVIEIFVTFKKVVTPTPPRPTPKTKYTLTVNVVGDGTVPGFEVVRSFNSGNNVSLTAVIGDPLVTEFDGWTDDASGISLETSVTMTGNKTVTATFAPIEILDEEIVEAAPETAPLEEIPEEELPQTGGLPFEGLALIGSSLVGLGLVIRKRK